MIWRKWGEKVTGERNNNLAKSCTEEEKRENETGVISRRERRMGKGRCWGRRGGGRGDSSWAG